MSKESSWANRVEDEYSIALEEAEALETASCELADELELEVLKTVLRVLRGHDIELSAEKACSRLPPCEDYYYFAEVVLKGLVK